MNEIVKEHKKILKKKSMIGIHEQEITDNVAGTMFEDVITDNYSPSCWFENLCESHKE